MARILPESVAPYVDAQSWLESYNNGLMLKHLLDDSLERDDGVINFEKGFNTAGYMPAISNISAVIRALYGVIIIVEGIARTTFNGLAFAYYSSCKDAYQKTKDGYIPSFSILHSKRKALNGLRFFSHGMANIGRAVVEFIPFFGNLTCRVYDELGLRLRYHENDKPRTLRDAIQEGTRLVQSQSLYDLAADARQDLSYA